MKSRLTAVLLAALIAVLALAPVSGQGAAITVSWPQEPDSLNPMYTTMTFAGYTYQLYLGRAWNFDDQNNAVPVLVSEMPSAENGGISEDGTTITLTLNEGMTWSDGDPLDSADFVFTYEMITSEANSPLTVSPYDRVSSVEAPDATTVVITFDEPFAGWYALYNYVLPEHVLAPVFEEEGTLDNAAFNRAPTVSSGPYVFQEWDTGNFMRFAANENYVGGTASIETIVVTFVPDDTTYVANLAAGQADIGTFIPAPQLPELEAAGLEVQVIPSGYNEGWFFNTGELAHPGLQDVNVRAAVSMGIDRAAIAEDLLLGRQAPAATYWDLTPYASPDVSFVPYDPEMAAQLLDEAGWVDSNGDGTRDKDGVELVLRYRTTDRQLRQDVQAVSQQSLAEIGVGIDIINDPSSVFFNGYADGGPAATGDYDIAQWSSSPDAFPDPSTFRFTCGEIPSPDLPSGGNWNYYCNEELDALFDAQATTVDFDARVAVFHEITELMAEEYVWVGLWQDPDFWVVNSRIQNAVLSGVTPFWDVVNWEVAE